MSACGEGDAARRERARAAYEQAVELARTGQLAAARERLAESVAADPSTPAVRSLYGVVLERLDDLDGAEQQMREAQRLAPGDADVGLHLARIASKRELDRRIALAHQSARERADDAEPRFVLTELLLERGRFDGALMEAIRAERLAGPSARSHGLLGLVYAGQQRHARALFHLSEAIRLGSEDARVRAELVFVLATSRADDLRDPARALREGESAALDGAPARLLDGLAAAYAATGRHAEAQRAIAIAIARAEASGDHVAAREMQRRAQTYGEGRSYLGPPVDPS